MSNRRAVRVVLGRVELLEARRLLDGGAGWWIFPPADDDDGSSGSSGYADLGGVVNLADFNRLANFNPGSVWPQGDFDYDGFVSLQDFNRLAANFGLSASGTNVTGADWAALGAAVGTVNLNDFSQLVSNFGFSAGPDGVVGPEDWAALASSIGVDGQVNWNTFARAQGATPPFTVTRDGTLTVTGTSRADRIVVDSSVLTQMRSQNPESRIRRIHVDAGAGNDVVEMRIGLRATIIGGKGDDQITAGGRADHISGGAGHDTIHGGGGDDTVEGMDGVDNIYGESGNDLIFGGGATDYHLYGGSGNDTMYAGAGGGVCHGQDGNDLLYGNDGNAVLYGGAGHDRFKCLDGNPDGIADQIYTGPAGQRDRVLAMDDDDLVQSGGVG